MKTPSIDLKKVLSDLSEADFPHMRQEAARKLGELKTSSEEIVQSLAVAEALDANEAVRAAARTALKKRAHQALLREKPDLLQNAVTARRRTQEEQEERETHDTIAEFKRRCWRENVRATVWLVLLVVFCGLLFFSEWMLRSFQVLVIASVVLQLWLSWRNWRCPACENWLGGWKAQISPFFAVSPLRCPHCGAKLL